MFGGSIDKDSALFKVKAEQETSHYINNTDLNHPQN